MFVGPDEPKPWAAFGTVAVTMAGFQFVALRFGLLTSAVAAYNVLVDIGWTLDVRAWYATGPNLGVAAMLALTLYSAYTATAGRLYRVYAPPQHFNSSPPPVSPLNPAIWIRSRISFTTPSRSSCGTVGAVAVTYPFTTVRA
jgi:hypothetical protein